MTTRSISSDPQPPPLRVGILAPPWVPVPPPSYGGTESVIDRLARGLNAAGHDVRLWTTGDSTCPVRRNALFGPARTDAMGMSTIELGHVLAGYEWFADERCDLVHDHTVVGPFVRHAGRPVITTNHGRFDQTELSAVYRRMPASVPIIAISHAQAATAIASGIRVDHVIHHGIDIAEVPEGTGRGDDRGQFLLSLGRMSPDKGIIQAIDAARATGARLVIAAKMREPVELAYFEHVVAPRCGDGIEFVGEVCDDEKFRLIGAASALLNPIQWPEPFGLVMIESLAAGTPVIATRRGAAPEIVRHGRTGFLCDDHDTLVAAVRAIGRIDRHECRVDVARRFGIGHMVSNHVAAYRRLLSDPVNAAGDPVVELSLL